MIRLSMNPAAAVMAGLILIAGAEPVLAQTTPPESAAEEALLKARGETYHRAPDTAQDPAELAATARLNATIVAHNDEAARQEAANRAAYAEAEARYRVEAAAAATMQANYEADQRAAIAARAEYDRARAVWEAMIRSCEASGRHDCRANAPY
tara:strand:- start:1390 stop:1848 length:459 start_codon:yes stop_codon:yes gene_type:complete